MNTNFLMSKQEIENALQKYIEEIKDNPEYPGENDIFNATDIAIKRLAFPIAWTLEAARDKYHYETKSLPAYEKRTIACIQETLFNIYDIGLEKVKSAFNELPEEEKTDEMFYLLNKDALEKIRYQCSFPLSEEMNPEDIKASCDDYLKLVADLSNIARTNPDKYGEIFVSLFNNETSLILSRADSVIGLPPISRMLNGEEVMMNDDFSYKAFQFMYNFVKEYPEFAKDEEIEEDGVER